MSQSPQSFNAMIDGMMVAAIQNSTDTSGPLRERFLDDHFANTANARVEKKSVTLAKCYELAMNIDESNPRARQFAEIALDIAAELVKRKPKASPKPIPRPIQP